MTEEGRGSRGSRGSFLEQGGKELMLYLPQGCKNRGFIHGKEREIWASISLQRGTFTSILKPLTLGMGFAQEQLPLPPLLKNSSLP